MGHVFGFGISVDPTKISAVTNWPILKNVLEMMSFLGLAGYYQKFLKEFSKIVEPLTKLMRKRYKYDWSVECDSSFKKLKKRLTTASMLTVLNGTELMLIYNDAFGKELCCVLMQHD